MKDIHKINNIHNFNYIIMTNNKYVINIINKKNIINVDDIHHK